MSYPEVSLLFIDGYCQFKHFTHDFIPLSSLKELGTLLQQIHQMPLITQEIQWSRKEVNSKIKTFRENATPM